MIWELVPSRKILRFEVAAEHHGLIPGGLNACDHNIEVLLDVIAQALIEWAALVVLVVEQHIAYRAEGVGIVVKLVLERYALDLRTVDLGKRELAQLVAYRHKCGHRDIVEERMAVHKEVAVVALDTALYELFAKRCNSLNVRTILLLQSFEAALHLWQQGLRLEA